MGFNLTLAERAVAAELCETNLTCKEIAAKRGVSPKTITAQYLGAYKKCGVHSRNELREKMGASDYGRLDRIESRLRAIEARLASWTALDG